METARRLVSLKPDIARIYPALVIKNTYMEDMFLRGEYKPLTVDEAARISKKLLIIFEGSGVNVIRIGLQPTENIEKDKDVVAGPFHPSMRQLVESLVYRDMLELLLDKTEPGEKEFTVKVNPVNVSELIGNRKSNLNYIKERFSLDKLFIVQDKSEDKDTLVLIDGEKRTIMSKKHYYSISTK
ncbi:MAG: hypothetical protein ACM3ZR_13495 [Pseudomonadota bacterium]